MARIRTIKPSFWVATGHMSREARLLAVGLISFADDKGRFIATTQAILGYVFPLDTDVTAKKLDRWLTEVATPRPGDSALVTLYQVNGAPYGYFPNYHRHQKINRPQPSSLPPPPDGALFEA
ncbi:hypothetical protein LQF12_02265 [Ruania suaedae]|uniref:hypothetical protein n=1 Tax=Ruania suaedae TaxID=2897774 RepID=UPI001E3B10B3|nr:hypothetical protein [Ruania suaedae]UFU03457.1 hypothetical protein LQF12_02265 [Ruania suaedae]